jgi:2-aminoethylphosphonate-pyruvate transaminase
MSAESSKTRDRLLFTPGPLTTSQTVKQALVRDLGSRDDEFIAIVAGVRRKLLEVAGVTPEGGYEAVLLQGSGTYGLEATVGSVVPRGGRLLVAVNGAYGERMVQIGQRLAIPTQAVRLPEDQPVTLRGIEAALASATHVAMVHCETTSGILNSVPPFGQALRQAGKTFILDAMSSFGAIPLDLEACGVDFLVSSSNKCLEGVPGLAFVIARREALVQAEGQARSLSLDLVAQWKGLEENGQFRFTPPTQVVLALHQALEELRAEGGVAARRERYSRNQSALLAGMRQMGFKEYLASEVQSPIITSFHYPRDPNFNFARFYRLLGQQGMVIYPGKVGKTACFRIGSIGRIFENDIQGLLAAVRRVLREMDVADGQP